MLSTDSGNQTVYLLGQISQQLNALSPNGIYIPPTPYPQSSPSLAIILVNCFWLLSLVLSISAALTATLVQQWARRYTQLPQIPTVPSERARVRAYLFLGISRYRMSRAVEAAPVLLHLSVFLFFAGLVIYFFTIFKAVAIVVSVAVGFFGFVYFILTVLPCIDHCCPYRTPVSSIWWYCWHTSSGFFALCARWFVKLLHGILVPNNSGEITSFRQRILSIGWRRLDDSVKKHGKRLKDGFRSTIIQRANNASAEVDPMALTWLLNEPALADKSKIQDFVGSVPGDTIVQLISAPIHSGKIFSQHLATLMRTCIPGSFGLDEDTRRRRLIVCLNAIHHIARAYSGVQYGASLPETLLEDVRINFANISLMRSLWVDADPSIRVTSRSICALLARHILRKSPLHESEVAWLEDVLGESSNAIYNSLQDVSAVDDMNVDSFVYGVLSHSTEDLPVAEATSFVDTLAILMNAGSKTALRRSIFEGDFTRLLRRAQKKDHLCAIVDKLRRISEAMFPSAAPKPSTSRG